MGELRNFYQDLYENKDADISANDLHSFTQNLKGPSQPMCNARRDTISGHFLCHRNSDLTRLKEKAYLSVDFVYLSNVLKVFSISVYLKKI